MAVLARKELEDSPLADLHALASELGIEGYRRLRRDDLISAIVDSQGGEGDDGEGGGAEAAGAERVAERETEPPADEEREAEPPADEERKAEPPAEERKTEPSTEERKTEPSTDEEREQLWTGVLDILPNGSGFVRADPYAHSPEDVYISPAQIRRCELRTGDEVSGPVRPPRRSERYPSLIRVETVNDGPAEPPAERPGFHELTPAFARVRLAAPEELGDTPFGMGSRVAIAGPPGAGATTLLRRAVQTLAEGHPELDVTVALAGVRPEEVPEWRSVVSATVVGGSFDGSSDRQGEVASMAVERAKRAAERGRHAAVVIDSLDMLSASVARRLFGAARNTEEAGSVTIIAATGIGPEPARHATTRITLKPSAESGAIQVDAGTSTVLRAELIG